MLVAQCVHLIATPRTVAYPVFSVHRIFQARVPSGLPFPSPGDLLDPGIKPGSSALQADSLPSKPLGKPKGSEIPHKLDSLLNCNI